MRSTWAIALCLVLPACASTPETGSGRHDPYSREGGYVAATGIYSVEMFERRFPFEDFSNSKGGAGVRFGYRGSTDTAIELIAEDIRGFRQDSRQFEASKLELQNIGVGGKLYFDGGAVQTYGLVGAGWTRALVSEKTLNVPFSAISFRNPYVGRDDAVFLRGGLGVEMYFTESFAAFLEASFNRVGKPLGDLNHVDGVVGVMLRF